MEINYVMAIDPGVATGIAIGRHSDTMPMEVIFNGIIPDGVVGFSQWLHDTNDAKSIIENDCSYNFPEEYEELDYHLEVVCEDFKLRGGNFSPDLTPLRIEGVVIDHFGSVVTWQAPADKKMVGDKFLKAYGFWVTGADVDHEDGRDANDAMLHLFVRAMRTRHMATLKTYFKG